MMKWLEAVWVSRAIHLGTFILIQVALQQFILVSLLTCRRYHHLWHSVTEGNYSAAITCSKWQLRPHKASCLR